MSMPFLLRGVVAFADRALDPRAAARNARRAVEELSLRNREQERIDRMLPTLGDKPGGP